MEGVVKFNCYWTQSGPVISDEQYEIINYWRKVLFNMNLIGAYENGVGYGNISMRSGQGNQFIITGSSTGEIPELEPGHYVKVVSFNIDDNAVQCIGPLKASSESLTHAAIYMSDPGTNAVVHIHSIDMWNNLIHKAPTTNPGMDYGTTELAKNILKILKEPEVLDKKIIVMAGDRAGILTFGHDMDEAVNILMQHLKK
ncbi:MAG: class II aldolase/adducin family protein [Bacteroidales bacterium]|nr:class II aldolase/adducin family protein [Bacteroidales bacterium]